MGAQTAERTGIRRLLPGGRKDAGTTMEPLSRETLQAIINAQVEELIDLGYNNHVHVPHNDKYSDRIKAVPQTEDEYRQAFTLPKEIVQPPTELVRSAELLVIDPRVELDRQLDAQNIQKNDVETDDIIVHHDHEYLPHEYLPHKYLGDRIAVFPRPYAIWTASDTQLHNESVGRFRHRPPTMEEIGGRLAPDEREAYPMELLAFYREHPEFLDNSDNFYKPLLVARCSIWPSSYVNIERQWSGDSYHKVLRSYPHLEIGSTLSVRRFGAMIVGRQVIRLGPGPKKIPEYNEHGVPLILLRHLPGPGVPSDYPPYRSLR